MQEDKLLNALKEGDKITGRVSIPDKMSSSLIQPAGRDWRDFQRSTLPIIGGVAIIGMLAVLAIFLMVRGTYPDRARLLGQDDPALRHVSSASPTG